MSTLTAPTVPVETREHYLNADYGIRSWLLTVDHKRIALLYLASITLFFFLGGFFAVLIRLELLTPQGDMVQSETYNKLFTMHGIIMIIFFLIPAIPAVLGNFLVPLMVGAKDLAFPRINLLSWYIYILGGVISLTSIVVGGVDTGWTFYTPYSSTYSNSYVITAGLGVFVAGFSSILTGLNFIVTIHKMRAPGLDLVPAAALHLGALCNGSHPDARDAGPGDHDCAAGVGERLSHRNFRSRLGWRSRSVPAPLLVLLASGRLHHDSARHGDHQ